MGFSRLKKVIKSITPIKIQKIFADEAILKEKSKYTFANLSYSQEGEDMILNRIFENQKNGFYVDVGALHPKRFSNTYLFYKKGWRGINIDAMPGSMIEFNRLRPEDVNLEIGVSRRKGELIYYIFNEPALNTFSEELALKRNGIGNYMLKEKIKIQTLPLVEILREHYDRKEKIDFMTIDVEGLDLEVLESNDWNRFRPKVILVEELDQLSIIDIQERSEVYKFLVLNGFELVSKSKNTLFFKDSRND